MGHNIYIYKYTKQKKMKNSNEILNDLNKLINDENYLVRIEVVRQGYRLDKLINDEHFFVREIAAEKLKELQNQ
jgi:hypothetical protein